MNLKYYKNKRVLITGASGFIGSHLAKALKGKTKKLILWDSKTDIRFWIYWQEIVKRVDIIFHLAGRVNQKASIEKPVEDIEINLLPIVKLIASCQEKRVFPDIIFAGTDTEEDPNATPYEINKLAAEKYLKYYATYTKGRAVTLRLGNVYGEGGKGIVNLMEEKRDKKEDFLTHFLSQHFHQEKGFNPQ
jgi:nucleoside-diphosphate-sugar epimerase